MKILFCNYEYPPLGGGGGVVNAWLAEELVKRHTVTVLTSRAFDLPNDSIENGVRVIRVPVLFRRRRSEANFLSMLSYLPTAIWRGAALLRREHFDVINTHFVLPTGPVGYVLSKLADIPNVLSVHGGDLYDPSKSSSPHRNWLLRVAVRRLALAADAIVAQSSNTLANLHRFFAPEADVSIIPLGIPRPPSATALRERYQLDEEDVVFVTIGRLVARKAVDQLVGCVAELGNPKVKLLVIGNGPRASALGELAVQLNVVDQIRFMGRIDEDAKREVLALSDVFVSTSQHEGFGLVFLEAMAAGLPVVCYDNGGQTDFLREGETGFVVPLNDRATFRQKCQELVASEQLRTSIGQRNLRLVEKYFIDRCAEEYEKLFGAIALEAGVPVRRS